MAEIKAIGNVAADAEIRVTQSGRAVLNFRIGDSKSRKDQQGNWETLAQTWYTVQVWGEYAEFLHQLGQIVKGARVEVIGEYYAREYDKKDGGKGISHDVNAWGVRVFPKRDQQGGYQPSPAAQQATQQANQFQQQNSPGGAWGAPAQSAWGNPSDVPF